MVQGSVDIKRDEQAEGRAAGASIRIGINCRSFMNRQYTGIGRYTSRLVEALSQIDTTNRYLLYAPKRLFSRKRVVPRIRASNFSVKLDRFKRGVQKTLGDIDVYHSPSPDIFECEGPQVVVTVHDLVYKAYPQGHTDQTLRMTDEQFRFFLPRAARIIACSRHTAGDLKKFFDVEESKVRVIYPGVDTNMFYKINTEQQKHAKQYIKNAKLIRNYILFVGTLEPRKNLKGLMEAFSVLKRKFQYKGQLAICGMNGWGNEDFQRLAQQLEIEKDTVFLGFVKDRQLRELYNLADVFVFPSFYEGFGYPIVEAFSCGCPVVASNRGSAAEVAGSADVSVDPQQPEQIARAINRVIRDPEIRDSLIAKGSERAKEFNFLNTARQTLKVYEEIYEG